MRRVCLLTAIVVVVVMAASWRHAPLAQDQPTATITVQPGGSIQAAIDSAPEGAVVYLPEGEWTEYVTIEKSLTLRGAGADRTRIRGKSSDGPVVRVRKPAGTAAIEDLTLTGGQGGKFGFGLAVLDTSVARVSRCVISANAIHGIVLFNRARCDVSNCTIRDNPKNGIVTYQDARALIFDSVVTGNGWSGVTVEVNAEADIAGCTISRNGSATGGADMGVIIVGNARATITACTIADNRMLGIGVEGPGQAEITGCSISGSKGGVTGGDGIQLWLSARATVTSCAIFDNSRHGVALKDTSYVALEGCRIYRNGSYGVALVEHPCFATDAVFTGRVAGLANQIPKSTEPERNALGATCPGTLSFLTTTEGGELDRRPSS